MRSAADVWEKVKSLMEGGMTAVSIETWFGDVEAVALEDTRLVLCVPTDFKRNIIRTRFLSTVEQALKELFWACFVNGWVEEHLYPIYRKLFYRSS